MYPASFFDQLTDKQVKCLLCPHECVINHGRFGKCNTRKNVEGELESANYGLLSAISMDPVEKKPLYHFYPGQPVLSIGSFGCNLKCKFCQNSNISQVVYNSYAGSTSYEPEELAGMAQNNEQNIGIAYTYNEPTVYFEFMMECARRIHSLNLKNIVVTNGFINSDPLRQLIEFADAFNIDLKSFSDEFYKNLTGSRLEPVLHSIKTVANSDCHLEVTVLLIPGLNDHEKEWKDLIKWLYDTCGDDIVLHVSRYYPRHLLTIPPTPVNTIENFLNLAKETFSFVYPGNTGLLIGNDTICPNCREPLILRRNYMTSVIGMGANGVCKNCNHRIYGHFKNQTA